MGESHTVIPGYLPFVLTAIASDTTHPMRLQPRKRLMTKTEPAFTTFRLNAMIVGRKYIQIATT